MHNLKILSPKNMIWTFISREDFCRIGWLVVATVAYASGNLANFYVNGTMDPMMADQFLGTNTIWTWKIFPIVLPS